METAFLKHITDEPDDVVARLVFADWLREQDDPVLNERGEFIHLQHTLAEGNVRLEERKSLVGRQKELLARHREQWEESFRGLVRNCEYRIGFAERVTLSAEQLVDDFAKLAERTPVVRVRLTGLTPDTVSVVASVEELARLRELDLNQQQQVSPQVLRELLASPYLGRLRSLNLSRTSVGDEGVRTLVASPVFRQLQYLNLSRTNMSISGVHALVNAIYTRAPVLQMLVLRGASQLQPGTFPPVPPGLPFPLRQSLQSQIGLDLAPPEHLLARLHATRETLSNDFRRLVEWLHTHGTREIRRAVKTIPLPDAVREAFMQVCRRRIMWAAKRLKGDPTTFHVHERHVVLMAQQVETAGALSFKPNSLPDDLAEAVGLLTPLVIRHNETGSLANCLLDLYIRHERGDLRPDGKTR